MAMSVCVSDFKLIKCQLDLKLKKYNKRVSCIYPKVRLRMATSVCVSDLIQIHQMSIKIEGSRNIANESVIDPKVRLQMATSVCVYILYSCSSQLVFFIKSI